MAKKPNKNGVLTKDDGGGIDYASVDPSAQYYSYNDDTGVAAPSANQGDLGNVSPADISALTGDASKPWSTDLSGLSGTSAINDVMAGSNGQSSSSGGLAGGLASLLKGIGLGGGNSSNVGALTALGQLISAAGAYKTNSTNSPKFAPPPIFGGQGGTGAPSSSTGGTQFGPGGKGYSYQNYASNPSSGYAARSPLAITPSYYTYGSGPEASFFAPVKAANGGSISTTYRYDVGGTVQPAMPQAGVAPPATPPPFTMANPLSDSSSTMGQRMQSASQVPAGNTAQQGALSMATGGDVNGAQAGKSRHVTGPGDGTSDSIPARLANGEYVIDAQAVSMLGNGDNSAGAKRLDEFRKNLRAHKGKALAAGKMAPDAKPIHKYMGGK